MASNNPENSTYQVGAYEAKTHFTELLERVENGQEVTITRHGQAIARLLPVKPRSTPEGRRAAIAAMRILAQGNSLGDSKIKDLIDEGRR